jgi:magnesium-protoporphyrin IX monomethyl ester (oxidative) cyclase
MRVTLVHPAGFNFVPGQPDLVALANRMAPIGVLQLAAWLERHHHPTAVIDCMGPRAPRGIAAQAEAVLATKPELLGISATTSAFMDAVEIAALVKQRRPEVRVVVGNVHASSLGAPLLRHFPELDYLCMGEGEGALLDLAEGKALAEVDNLVWRDGERIVSNRRRARIERLDDLPYPAYDKLPGYPGGYHLPLFSHVKRYGATMITSRGCPFTCSFCDRTVFEHKYRYNSAAYIHEHMRHLRDRFGVHHVNFYDDLFTANRRRIHELCELLIAKPLGMHFNCAIRAGQDDAGMFRLLKRAGALMVSMGIESADPVMMERHKAGVTLDEVRATVRDIHAAGLRAKGLFIFGLPGETPQTVRTTSAFIQELGLDEINISKFSPLHGAPIWDECISGESGELHEDWRLMNCMNFVFLPEGFASREEMDEHYNAAVRGFYTSKTYQRRFARRLWQHRWSLWHLARHLPTLLRARRYYDSDRHAQAVGLRDFARHPRHPRQPLALPPVLGPGLLVGKRNAVAREVIGLKQAA